tara:strand:- start:3807 stop:5441 length:1635 start_codon:yes stop_codon:yes gene_type:complete
MGEKRIDKMDKRSNMNTREKIFHRVTGEEKLNKLILLLLGLSDTSIKSLDNTFGEQEKVKIDKRFVLSFEEDHLKQIPDIVVNTEESFEANATWMLKSEIRNNKPKMRKQALAKAKKQSLEEFNKLEEQYKFDDMFEKTDLNSEERLIPSDFDNYTNQIQKAADTIYPLSSESDTDLIPITILLPSSTEQEGDSLIGKTSSWKFITIKNTDSDDKKKLGFNKLAENVDLFFGLRLFLVMKAIGLTSTNSSENNGSKVFIDLLNSTSLAKHFNLLNADKVRQYIKLTTKLASLKRKLDGLDRTKKESIKKINESITSISNILNDMSLVATPREVKSGVYFALPVKNITDIEKLDDENNIEDIDPDEQYVLPTLNTSLRSDVFTTNKLGVDKNNGKPELRIIKRMRYMLANLLPFTSGTAITFYIKKENEKQEIRAPLLILPKEWDSLAAALKTHHPLEELPEYSEDDEKKFRNDCLKALYPHPDRDSDEKDEYARFVPVISDVSGEDIKSIKYLKPGTKTHFKGGEPSSPIQYTTHVQALKPRKK